MPEYKLQAPYAPKGDQPAAIKGLVGGVNDGEKFQTLLGATGTVKDLETNNETKYRLVGQDEANIANNLIYYKSPIGKSLIGKNLTDLVTVNTPSGERNFEILKVEYI